MARGISFTGIALRLASSLRSKRCHPPFIEAERQSGVQPDRSRVREFLKFSSSLNACCIHARKDSTDRRLIDLAGESRGEVNEPSAARRWQTGLAANKINSQAQHYDAEKITNYKCFAEANYEAKHSRT